MEPAETQPDALATGGHDGLADAVTDGQTAGEDRGLSWLSAIADQLERDPQECWQAFEGLATVEEDLRLSIIDELSALAGRPGAQTLLRLLSAAEDPATRAAARAALERTDGETHRLMAPSRAPIAPSESALARHEIDADQSARLPVVSPRQNLSVVRSLVTPVDGLGRGTIVISVNRDDERRTAAFLCDVRLGIRDVVAEVEPESAAAGGLIDVLDGQPEDDCVRDAHELALGLLAGSLLLCGPQVPGAVSNWLAQTLGPEFQPAGFPASIPGLSGAEIPQTEMSQRASDVLDACPSWLDLSPLTFELAEEISLREQRSETDRERDAGAYRFLFEHRLIHRLELYRRMLLWMAWLWKISGEIEVSRSALALAEQLADEQYAVPSHPFTVELTMRSLKAAQGRLGTEDDPRNGSGPRS